MPDGSGTEQQPVQRRPDDGTAVEEHLASFQKIKKNWNDGLGQVVPSAAVALYVWLGIAERRSHP